MPAAGPMAQLDDCTDRIARLLVEQEGLVPATACCCAGRTATRCSPPGSACSRRAESSSRPCRCSARARSRRSSSARRSATRSSTAASSAIPPAADETLRVALLYTASGPARWRRAPRSLQPLPPADTRRDDVPHRLHLRHHRPAQGLRPFSPRHPRPGRQLRPAYPQPQARRPGPDSAPIAFTFGLGMR